MEIALVKLLGGTVAHFLSGRCFLRIIKINENARSKLLWVTCDEGERLWAERSVQKGEHVCCVLPWGTRSPRLGRPRLAGATSRGTCPAGVLGSKINLFSWIRQPQVEHSLARWTALRPVTGLSHWRLFTASGEKRWCVGTVVHWAGGLGGPSTGED